MVWLLAGVFVGMLNGLLRVWTVSRVKPDAEYSMWPVIIRGVLARLGLVAALLTLAVRQEAINGLYAFVGLWLVRWLFVRWAHLGRINWLWDVVAISKSR